MLILFLCKVLFFLFAAIPVSVAMLAAWNAARSPVIGTAERFLLASAYGTAVILASVGIPGMLGCLSVFSVEICCLVFSVGLYLLARRRLHGDGEPAAAPDKSPSATDGGAAPEKPSSFFPLKLRGEKFCFGLLLCGTEILCLACFAAHLGTDTFFYHLYFPAMWLQNGSLAYVPVPGYTCEYYPAYGEMLFCFLMAPMSGSADFACLLQVWALVLNAGAVCVLGNVFGASRTASLASAALVMFTSMVLGNAAMAYTDVLNGGYLAAGVALLCAGASRRHMPSCLGAGILLGIAASIKLTGLMLSPVLALAVMTYFFVRKPDARKCVAASAGMAVVFAAPFYLRSWIVTGNPFYPVRVPPFFNAGLEFERSAVGFTAGAWDFFFRGGSWGLNIPSGVLWGLTPFAVLAVVLISQKTRERALAIILTLALIALFAVQLSVYPEIAQARQYIPWIMTGSLLLPVALTPAAERFPRAFLVALLLLLLAVYYSPIAEKYGLIAIPLAGAAMMFMPDRWIRRTLCAVLLLSLPVGLFLSVVREMNSDVREHGNVLAFGRGPAECIRLVIKASEEEGPKTTAVTGTKFSFGFMEDAAGNRVVSVPINKKNSLKPHEFGSLAEMRADPVDAEEWIARLDAAGADYLYVEISDEAERLPDPAWEIRMASAHPERFRLLYRDDLCALFQVLKK